MNAVTPRRRPRPAALLAMALLVLAACAARERIVLEPGIQVEDAEVDVQTGSVTVEKQGVTVAVQAALLPAPRGDALHPTFWVTVENRRDERIEVGPGRTRLVDADGNQHAPAPMSVGRGGTEVRYALVDPEVYTYVSLYYGWPYYPIYPYRSWFAHARFSRVRYWHYDPFWSLGVGPIWITEIRRPRPRPAEEKDDAIELVYRDARLTFTVVFPELDSAAPGPMRLIVPELDVDPGDEGAEALEFEFVFEHVPEVARQ